MFHKAIVFIMLALLTGALCTPISSPTANPDPYASKSHSELQNLKNYKRINIPYIQRIISPTLFKMDHENIGYTLDPCHSNKDCKEDRECLNEHLTTSCTGNVCVCFPRAIQFCDMKCTDCSNYPNETCGYLPEDLPLNEERRPIGMCVSKSLVYNKLVVEVGCK